MKLHKLIFVSFILLYTCNLLTACVSPGRLSAMSSTPDSFVRNTVHLDEKIYNLSGEPIKFLIRNPDDKSGIVYFNMHDNENTCVTAIDSMLTLHSAKFIELQFKGNRWIGGWMNDKRHFWFDPNRIYSDFGIFRTLQTYNSFTPENKKQVRIFSKYILDTLLADAQMIVAVHNNMKGYSIEKYMSDSIFEESAAKIHYDKKNSPHDFFFVNDPIHFEYFKNLGYNAILQSQKPEDDGSLSVYCALKKIPYINVEAMEGHLEEQKRMLEDLQKLLQKR
jgi:hypothetical protein